MKRFLFALFSLIVPSYSFASDLSLPNYTKAVAVPSSWFFIMGLETGGRVTNHSFDLLNTGTGTIEIGGALAGGLFGIEYKNTFFMFRAEVDGDYDFGKGGSPCFNMGISCNINHGGIVTERVDVGLPQAWLGGVTPFASVGVQQSQTFAAIPVAGIAANQWNNAFLAGAGLDIPAGSIFSFGVRWDHVWPAQAIGLSPVVPVVANVGTSDIFKLNMKWRLN